MKPFLLSPGSRDLATSAGLLVLRVGTGLLIALGHGLPKVQNWSAITERWQSPGFPPLSWMSTPVSLGAVVFAELICGALIVLGLFTRPAALVLAFTMMVAAFYAHGSDPWFMAPGVTAAKEMALLYLAPALALVAAGAGNFSVDARLYRERRRWGR